MKTTVMNVKTFAGFNLEMIMKSVGIAYISTIFILTLLASLLAFTGLSENFAALGLVVTAMTSNVIGGMLIARNSKTRGWLNGGVGGAVYVILLYVFGALFYNSFGISKNTLIMLIICLISGAIGGIIGVNIKYKRRV
jgi:putative membrane protein (TIGR04086 family)